MKTRLWTPWIAVLGILLLAGCGEQQEAVTGLTSSSGSIAEIDLGTLASDDGLTERDLTGVTGTDFVTAGTGTRSNDAETITVEVPAGATVTDVFLYWSRRVVDPSDAPASEILVDGSTVAGSVVGGPIETSDDLNTPVTYLADLTGEGLVGAGTSSFTVEDDAPGTEGASVLVFYNDGGDASEFSLWDGVDFAWGVTSEPAWRQNADPVTFTFTAAGEERSAQLVLFVGDVDGGDRPNQLDVTIGGGATQTVDQPFFAADGQEWDNYVQELTIPAGVSEVTVEPISPSDEPDPASLLWAAAGLSVEPPEDDGGGDGCTPGYWRQPHHFDSWVDHDPDDLLGSVFDLPGGLQLDQPEHRTDPDDLTLHDGVVLRGGGVNALIRHSVAALLNASSGDVDYDLTVSEVVMKFNAAVDGGDVDGLKGEFESFNEQGCPLNGGSDESTGTSSTDEDDDKKGGPPSHAGPPGGGPPGQGG